MVRLRCECGLEMCINGLREEMVEYKCPRCLLPIGRPITKDDRMALAARKFWAAENKKEEGRNG